ncbi:putative WalW protein [Magnetofaba australis IT-1]|uniref:Putative WalW protein n=1 Tax=Magnetofaba australis IT-1 TaxID=1434232 RepID=A0A1Y2JYS3_9PROT|nr:putative WalW protein [Magnetofaba australis IT-1]
MTPPFDEEVNARNAYPGNLPLALERAKLMHLTDAITQNFGQRPTVYKAGRYGFGPHTAHLLGELGYRVDLSPSPGFDQSADGGPDYARFPSAPFTFSGGEGRRLLCLPTSGGYAGWLGGWGPALQHACESPLGQMLKLTPLLDRSRAMARMRLSPEGYDLGEMQRMTRHLLGCGERVVTVSLHSPSLATGNTPYVRDEEELAAFLGRLGEYIRWFIEDVGGKPAPQMAELAQEHVGEPAAK